MRKKLLLIILSCLISVSFSFAGNVVPVQDAKTVCKNYLNSVHKNKNFELSDFTLAHTEYDENGEALYYRFSISGQGFVIVSATEEVTPVLAYSTESDFVAHESVNFVIEGYKRSIINAKQAATHNVQANRIWSQLKDAKPVYYDYILVKEHEPIVTSRWNQSKFYNFHCPADSRASASQAPEYDYDDHVPAGCVAVNMASIMYYYRYPQVGRQGVSYRPVHIDEHDTTYYPRQTADFQNTTYNFNAMMDAPTNYAGEVAKILWHNGISVHMGYGYDGSGAVSYSSNGINALEAMKKYWRFNSNAGCVSKNDMQGNQAANWAALIMNEVDSMRPIYYSAARADGGHAFLFDGYRAYNTVTTLVNYIYANDTTFVPNEETGLIDTVVTIRTADSTVNIDTASYEQTGYIEVHVNWGWGGAANGYFMLNGVGHVDNYTEHEQLFTEMYPEEDITKPVSDTTRIIATEGSISDGAGNQKYQPNTDRRWIVSAPDASSYTFTFSKLKTEQGADVIKFYNAANPTTPIQTFSGVYPFGECPAPFTIQADSVLVRFQANGNDITDYGFVIDFVANGLPAAYCSERATIRDTHGVISDKGDNYADFAPDAPYRPAHTCLWTINPDNLSRVYFSVTKFEMGLGDAVDIFDIYTNPSRPTLLQRFDLFNFPSQGVYTFDSRRIRVQFVADNYDEGNGFEMTYEVVTGIEDHAAQTVSVYPNPVTDKLFVEFTDDFQGQTNFRIFDMAGKVISAESVNYQGGVHTISTANLSKGMYILHIQSEKGRTVSKFIVE